MTLPGMTSIPCVRFAMAHRDDKAHGYVAPTAASMRRFAVGLAIAAAWRREGAAEALRSVVPVAGEREPWLVQS